MSPLQDFTDALSGEQYVSISHLKPVLHLFNTSTLAEEENDTQLTKDVRRNILAYLNEKHSDPVTDDLLDIVSFLDPRFRTTYMKKEKMDQVISRAVEEIKSLKDQQGDTPSGAAAAGLVLPPEEKRKKLVCPAFSKGRAPAAWAAVETHSQRREASKSCKPSSTLYAFYIFNSGILFTAPGFNVKQAIVLMQVAYICFTIY